MSELRITGAVKRFGSVGALRGADLTVPTGSLTAVLGPSGCGKTTLLRCVAGFERLDRGEIRLDDRLVAGPGRHVPAHRRRVAVVPQEGALFPHLSVAGNVGYGLTRGARRAERIAEVLDLVGLGGYGDRMPHQLSGGQQQRVAVARALAPRPPLILLDEPFSALDAGLRTELRHDIRQALRADGATVVLVTHDQQEALSTADQIAVLREGRIVQVGTPTSVYAEPVDRWVAGFVGDAVLLPAVVGTEGARTAAGVVPIAGAVPPVGSAVTVLLRPEQIHLAAPSAGQVPARVCGQVFHGHHTLVTVELSDASRITARVTGGGPGDPGPTAADTEVGLRISGTARAWPADDQATTPSTTTPPTTTTTPGRTATRAVAV
ncbi:ABC transporter ATP-binding protein [Micromonospora sp. NBC_01813]|uniref:ABC transporter ATP-binding protein n=1 Tax=Micromonospora sp. NBC_01813 TaxID=2975988 RepID=UPI002DD79F10|nr:ABC transporter ATP-binding protein [Micromonospora sp. NBC_01813]WSA08594.1 ABC transporter ATP-binding protein [Micromonospora sp. NBC_01813]